MKASERAQAEYALAQIEHFIWQKRDYLRTYPETEKRLERAVAEARKELDE